MLATAARTMKEEKIDGKLFVRSWQPDAAPRAVIVICHGVNSHSGQYLWAGQQFAEAGYAAYALDLRGRGRSEGPRFYAENISDYVDDVASTIKLAKSRHPGLPVFLLGHSAGGVTSCTYALDHQNELAGFICESFAYKIPAPGLVLAIVKGLGSIAPKLPVLTLHMKDFTRNKVALAALEADPLTKNEKQPARTVAALIRGTERMKREFSRITLPVFILHGTLDKATMPAGSQEFYANAGSKDKTLKLYEGHYHDLLNDLGKEQVMGDMLDWIGKHLPKA